MEKQFTFQIQQVNLNNSEIQLDIEEQKQQISEQNEQQNISFEPQKHDFLNKINNEEEVKNDALEIQLIQQPLLKKQPMSMKTAQPFQHLDLKRNYSDSNYKELIQKKKTQAIIKLIEMGYEIDIVSSIIENILVFQPLINTEMLFSQAIEDITVQQQKLDAMIGIKPSFQEPPQGFSDIFSFENLEQQQQQQIQNSPLKRHISIIQRFISENNNELQKKITQKLTQNKDKPEINQNIEIQQQQIQNFKECEICTIQEEDENSLNQVSSNCACKFHQICLQQYILTEMNKRNFTIACPSENCKIILSDSDVQRLVTPEIYTEYQRKKDILKEENDPNIAWCPSCFQKVIRSEKDKKKTQIICSACHRQMCFLCRKQAHGTLLCDQAEQDDFDRAKKLFSIKDCPKCTKPIQKSAGCNHMTCSQCKYQFCWICLKTYSSNHYKRWNICGCPGFQYSAVSNYSFLNSIRNLFCVLLYIIAILALLPVLYVLIFALHHVFTPVRLSLKFLFRKLRYHLPNNCFAKCLTCFFVGLIFCILSYPVMLLNSIIPGYCTILPKFYKKLSREIFR